MDEVEGAEPLMTWIYWVEVRGLDEGLEEGLEKLKGTEAMIA